MSERELTAVKKANEIPGGQVLCWAKRVGWCDHNYEIPYVFSVTMLS